MSDMPIEEAQLRETSRKYNKGDIQVRYNSRCYNVIINLYFLFHFLVDAYDQS